MRAAILFCRSVENMDKNCILHCACVSLGFLLIAGIYFAAFPAGAGGAPSVGGEAPLAWTAPHLTAAKTASPSEIWVRSSQMAPSQSVVTLTVAAEGDPCSEHVPVDVVLGIDTTGSMADAAGPLGSKLDYAKAAAQFFITTLDPSQDRVALVQFDTSLAPPVKLVSGYTGNAASLHSVIDSMAPGGKTPFYDATAVCVEYANINHAPAGQTHPHSQISDHHQPVVIVLTDGVDTGSMSYDLVSLIDLVRKSHDSPPPADNMGYETRTFLIGLGSALDSDGLRAIAEAGNGSYYPAPTGQDLQGIYANISSMITKTHAARKPNSVDSMIKDVLPKCIGYSVGTCRATTRSTIFVPQPQYVQGDGGLWELRWDVQEMKLGDVFEVTYEVYSTEKGWQSVGVTGRNATSLASDYCKVSYENYRYYKTNSPDDIWENETPEARVLVKEPYIIDITGQTYFPPMTGPAPPGQPILAPLDLPLSLPLQMPLIQGLVNPVTQGVVQPQLLATSISQGLLSMTMAPNFIGLVMGLGMMEKIRVSRKMRAMRLVVGRDEKGPGLAIGE